MLGLIVCFPGQHFTLNYLIPLIDSNMAQWSQRGALSMSLPVVWFQIPFGARFSEKTLVSPLTKL